MDIDIDVDACLTDMFMCQASNDAVDNLLVMGSSPSHTQDHLIITIISKSWGLTWRDSQRSSDLCHVVGQNQVEPIGSKNIYHSIFYT